MSNKNVQRARNDMEKIHKQSNELSFIALIWGLALGAGVAIFLVKALSRPMKQLSEGRKRTSDGDLNYKVQGA